MHHLFESALASLTVAEGGSDETQSEVLRRRRIVESQIAQTGKALTILRNALAEIEAIRIECGESFRGVGSCEWGHEGCGVTVEWPQLAGLADSITRYLKEVQQLDQGLLAWYVLYGSGEYFKAYAEDREHALEQCRNAYPGETVHVAVPANEFGGLVLHSYDEAPVSCPKCGHRTEMGELSVADLQIHVCGRCDHSFIAFPDEEVVEA